MDDFLFQALAASLGLSLISGPLGVFVVWLRMAYFGDTLAYSMLLGILAHGSLAVGLIAISLHDDVRIDLMAYLFGDILAVGTGELL